MRENILLVDDETAIVRSFASLLESRGFAVETASSVAEAKQKSAELRFDAIVCDLRLPDGSGIDLLEYWQESSPDTVVVVMTAYASTDTAVSALKFGAADYMTKPIHFDSLLDTLHGLLAARIRRDHEPRESPESDASTQHIVGESPCIQRMRELIDRVARTRSTVLISGESGTGKELVARRVHARSERAHGPFIPVNCSAIPENLVESELFGYRKGAFTGADRDKVGLLELANRGTVFLDEIGDFPISLQPKLLRALEQREIQPLGSTATVKLNARFVAATNRPLKRMIEEGSFREDLFYRLSLFEIVAPPLRRCQMDIPVLVEHFIAKLNRELALEIEGVDEDALARLVRWGWPGNVRELENRVQRAMILCQGPRLGVRDFWDEAVDGSVGKGIPLRDIVRRYELDVIRTTIARCGGDKKEASRQLEISLASLYSKLQAAERIERAEAG